MDKVFRNSIIKRLTGERLLPVWIFALAFLLRLVVLGQARGCPWFDVPVVDAFEYDQRAREILGGTFLWKEVDIHGPLYPYFLALLYLVGGGFKYYLLRIVQVLIGSLNTALVYLLTRKVMPRAGAVIASLGAALYWIFIYFDLQILPTSLEILLGLLLLRRLSADQERPRPAGWLVSGILLGLSGISRPNALLLIPAILIWMIALARGKIRAAGWITAFLAGVILVVGPVTWRNYRVSGNFVLVQANTGLNLYLGNNPEADGTPYVRPGKAWRELQELPAVRAGRKDPFARDEYFAGEVFRFADREPARFLKLQLRKFLLFWNAHEIRASADAYFFTRYSPLLRFLSRTITFAVIGPLALLGFFLLAGEGRKTAPLYLYSLGYLVTVVGTVVSARYRAPVVPLLLIFAAYPFLWSADAARKKRFRPRLAAAGALVFFFLLVNAPVYRPDPVLEAEEYENLGFAYLSREKYEEAEAAYREAARIDPRSAEAQNGIGKAGRALNRKEEAVSALERAIALDPGYAEPYYHLGTVWLESGKKEKAIEYYRKSARLESKKANRLFVEGALYYQLDRRDAAIKAYVELCALAPDMAEAHYNLGLLYQESGRLEEAAAAYRRAIAARPRWADAYVNLGTVYQMTGKTETATGYFLKALELAPENGIAHNNLAAIYYQSGRYGPAIEHCDRALALGYPVHPELVEMLKPHRK